MLATPTVDLLERESLVRAFQTVKCQIDRLERRLHKLEDHFQQLPFRFMFHHSDLLKLSFEIRARLDAMKARAPLEPVAAP